MPLWFWEARHPALPKDSALSPVIAKIQAGELIWHEAYIDPENPYPLDQKFLSAIRIGTDFFIASQKGNATGIISMLAYDAQGQLTAAWTESVQPHPSRRKRDVHPGGGFPVSYGRRHGESFPKRRASKDPD